MIWTELPNGGLSTERSRARKERLLKGIVDRDGNHPSIIIWTIVNENWGVDLVHDASHRAWLKQTYHWLKSYDPTRLVVDNSPLSPSFHVETDIADYHFYAAFPDNRRSWDAFVDELASRPDWLFSPEGDAVIKGDEPVMCSEFGNWGLPYPKDLHDANGRSPGGSRPAMTGARASCTPTASRTASSTGASTAPSAPGRVRRAGAVAAVPGAEV